MIYIIIGVFTVLMIMNLFLFLVIRQMGHATGRQIAKDAMRLYAVYDKLLEEKSAALKEMEQQFVEIQEKNNDTGKKPGFLWSGNQNAPNLIPFISHYRDSGFTEAYHLVEDTFHCGTEEVLGLVEALYKTASRDYEIMNSILATFRFDQICRIMALEKKVQKEFIHSALNAEQQEIYDSYLKETGRFELSGFLDYVRIERCFLDHSVIVYTGNKSLYVELKKRIKSGMDVQFDGNICEGFKLAQGNRMYDYSI